MPAVYETPSLIVGMARGATLACPRCGSRGLFRNWLIMEPECPTCALHFERDPGYWLGSVMVNTGVTEGVFAVVLVFGMIVFWPDVPWVALLAGGVAVAAVVPIVFHPFSRTLWVAAERHVSGWSEGSLHNPIRVARDGTVEPPPR